MMIYFVIKSTSFDDEEIIGMYKSKFKAEKIKTKLTKIYKNIRIEKNNITNNLLK